MRKSQSLRICPREIKPCVCCVIDGGLATLRLLEASFSDHPKPFGEPAATRVNRRLRGRWERSYRGPGSDRIWSLGRLFHLENQHGPDRASTAEKLSFSHRSII